MECIILAGGLGTRLQSLVQDVPKCMAPVNGKPFLHFLFDYAEQQGCTKIILSLGYKHEQVTSWLKTKQRSFAIDYVIEETPLGTGGGIQLALQKATSRNVIVLNGDTMFRVPLQQMMQFHIRQRAATTVALKLMHNFDRYGVVKTDNTGRITAFEEKKPQAEGLINGGIYIIDKDELATKNMPPKFSFEKDYFEAFVQEGKMFGYLSDGYFIDIGIPSDYEQAQKDFE